jgi:hypothetical protein
VVAQGSSENSKQEKPPPAAAKPVSLHPLEFEEAVRDLLRVKPRRKEPEAQKEGGRNDG